MKKIHYLIPLFLVSVFVSAQTMVFNVQEVKVKDYLESKLEEAPDNKNNKEPKKKKSVKKGSKKKAKK